MLRPVGGKVLAWIPGEMPAFDMLPKFIDQNDIVALTREAAEISGITYVMEADMEEAEKILG